MSADPIYHLHPRGITWVRVPRSAVPAAQRAVIAKVGGGNGWHSWWDVFGRRWLACAVRSDTYYQGRL